MSFQRMVKLWALLHLLLPCRIFPKKGGQEDVVSPEAAFEGGWGRGITLRSPGDKLGRGENRKGVEGLFWNRTCLSTKKQSKYSLVFILHVTYNVTLAFKRLKVASRVLNCFQVLVLKMTWSDSSWRFACGGVFSCLPLKIEYWESTPVTPKGSFQILA